MMFVCLRHMPSRRGDPENNSDEASQDIAELGAKISRLGDERPLTPDKDAVDA
jgi:hypothetical protein